MSAAKIAASLRSTRSSAIEKPRLHSNVGGISGSNNVRFGSKQTCAAKRHDRESGIPHKTMSALPPKADMCGATRDVRYGPKADMTLLFDNLIGAGKYRRRNCEAHCLRGFEVDY